MDGYSRLIVYMHCADNNRASAVLEQFERATQEFSIPSQVRADRGGENTTVATYMVMHRGEQRGTFISGRSIHNQGIERMWRDVFSGCTSLFYDLFNHMEQEGLLNPDNEVHVFCLHCVFLPRINNSLAVFTRAWNNHPLSSVRNLTPHQLWISGDHPQDDSNSMVS